MLHRQTSFGCNTCDRESVDSVSRSIKRGSDADMQSILNRLMSCIGLSGSADTALVHDMDSDLETLLEAPRSSAPEGGVYFVSSVSPVLKNLGGSKLGREDAC